jgi:hypothetical protein
MSSISTEIKEIFEKNKIEDLKRFLRRRQNLNNSNMYLIYLFHLVQSAGILTTTIAAGYDQRYLIWIGVGLNMLASLIDIYEKTNNNISKKLLADIQKIKEGTYVDEGTIVEPEQKSGSHKSTKEENAVGIEGGEVESPLLQNATPKSYQSM